MSFLRGLFGSLGSIFADPDSPHQSSSMHNPSSSTMDVSTSGAPTMNERVAYKLKGYFDLAKEEIAKAVRAEEWGLIDDAILHYRNAQSILGEGASTRAPSYASPRFRLSCTSELLNLSFSFAKTSTDHQKVKSYHQKITKWQGEVAERLQALNQRRGDTILDKMTRAPLQAPWVPQKQSNSARNAPRREPALSGISSGSRTRRVATGVSKSNQDSGGKDTKLAEMINTVIVDRSPSVKWDDVAGLEKAKRTLFEMVILPTKRRDLFTGLRRPPRGLLLFGPPGNGKTMLAKAVASECDATFFNVSASSLTSKWVGEGEKLVRTLFMVAISRQPSVIFMDEIDSIMSTRQANEHDASRRLKSEFLVQFDGVTSNPDDLVVVIGATNKPQELDDAVLRRLVKRIYIPLPDQSVRRLILQQNLKGQAFSLPGRDLEKLTRGTEGYSGSDLQALCEEAAMMPIRELGQDILTVKANEVRPLKYEDFQRSMAVIRPSLQKSKWEELERWNQEFGSN